MGSIKPSEPSKSPKNADEKRNKANANPTGVNRLTVASCENVYLRRPGQVLVGRWSVDPMDADIVMSPEYDGGDVDCNVEACYPVGDGSLALGDQETPTADSPTLR